MTTRNGQPPILIGCDVLPPMEPAEPTRTNSEQPTGKHKTGRQKTAKRFAEMNNFVDFTMGSLTRNEIAVWFVLFRDCRNEIAATSQADIARRAGVSDRTVRRVVKRLEMRSLLKTVYKGGLQRGPSKYRVLPLAKPP